jgi:hypothetical protein
MHEATRGGEARASVDPAMKTEAQGTGSQGASNGTVPYVWVVPVCRMGLMALMTVALRLGTQFEQPRGADLTQRDGLPVAAIMDATTSP